MLVPLLVPPCSDFVRIASRRRIPYAEEGGSQGIRASGDGDLTSLGSWLTRAFGETSQQRFITHLNNGLGDIADLLPTDCTKIALASKTFFVKIDVR